MPSRERGIGNLLNCVIQTGHLQQQKYEDKGKGGKEAGVERVLGSFRRKLRALRWDGGIGKRVHKGWGSQRSYEKFPARK